MSIQRLKRLQRLEARQSRGRPWVDPYDTAMALWSDLEAVAGRACWIPQLEPERSENEQAVFDRTMRELDRIGERLRAEREAA